MRKFGFLTAPISLLFCLVFSSVCTSQEVNSSAGEHFENASGSISFTLGESSVLTFGTPDGIITQGFHQPLVKMEAIPTMSDWGFFICAIWLLIIGTLAIYKFDMKNSSISSLAKELSQNKNLSEL